MPCILSSTTYIQNTLKYIKETLLTKRSSACPFSGMGSLSESEIALWFTKLRSTAHKICFATPQQQVADRAPLPYGLPDTLCAALLATVDFDTFTGELFGFNDEFYVKLLPHQSNYTVNTPMQYTHSQMSCQLKAFMI